MKKVLGIGACALVCLSVCVAAAFAAGLPTFKSDLIVPNRSLAGVTLKSTYTQAIQAFRSGSKGCSTIKGCSYRAADGSTFAIVFARLTTKSRPFVAEIAIQAGEKLVGKTEKGDFNTPMAALKTSSGIGLGSTAAAVKRAYPHATGNALEGYSIKGHGAYGTEIHFLNGRVSFIQMEAVHLG